MSSLTPRLNKLFIPVLIPDSRHWLVHVFQYPNKNAVIQGTEKTMRNCTFS